MSKLSETNEVIKEITKEIDRLTEASDCYKPLNYEMHMLIRQSINTTVLVDIAKSLAILADAATEEDDEDEDDYEFYEY